MANLAVDKPAQAPELYPNPTSDSFQIAHLPKNAKISVVDNSGKTVMTVSNVNENQAFSTTELSARNYVVLVQSKFGISSHKLVVNKN
jgi:hypothetical protein